MSDVISPRVSVVIASHRPDRIGGCLGGFSTEICGEKGVEVIVVADYAIDGFAEKFPHVRWMYHADTSISAKRNRGVSRAAGDIVGFTDDDCIPQPGWIAHAVEFLDHNGHYAGVAGQTSVERVETASYPLREFKRLERPGLRTNNIFYRKSALNAAGGFDERFTVQREDVDLAFSIQSMGQTIGYCSDVKVLHCHRDNERWDLLKNCWNRRFDPLLYKKHPIAYRKWIGTPFTPSIAMMFFMHVMLGASCLAGGPLFWSIATAADGGCATMLAIRRNSHSINNSRQIVRDVAAYCIAPFILLAALLHGGIRYGKLLLW
jgi:glycosyltransferase involved in cell wall biosynthesis